MLTALLILAFAVGGAAAAQETDGLRASSRNASYVVVFRPGVEPLGATRTFERRFSFRSRYRYAHALRGFAAVLTPEQHSAVARDPRVASVTLDFHVRPSFLDALQPGETMPTGIRRIGAALTSPRRPTSEVRQASTVNVAVIDTGVDLDHPDLEVVSGTDCAFPGTDADDDHGHGTHVAGTIAARNTGAGVVGVVPGTTVYAVKALYADQSTPVSVVICGIDWVTANAATLNIKVANMSLGGLGSAGSSCSSDPFRLAICNSTASGVTYVVAAGNDAANLGNYAPASYPEVLTVTAMSDSDGQPGGLGGTVSCPSSPTPNADDSASNFSNYATTAADAQHVVAAPGKCILSTWLGGVHAAISGTSMASPHVAGVVALCLGSGGRAGPCTGLTPAQIIARIRADAAAAPPGYGFTGVPGRIYGDLVRAGVYR